jgi:hypothetical protein
MLRSTKDIPDPNTRSAVKQKQIEKKERGCNKLAAHRTLFTICRDGKKIYTNSKNVTSFDYINAHI